MYHLYIKRRIAGCFYSTQKDLNSFFFYCVLGWAGEIKVQKHTF